MKATLPLTLLLLTSQLFAAESDHYSRRHIPLPDMAPVINAKANEFLNASLKDLNEAGGCGETPAHEKRLYRSLKRSFANHMKGKLSKYVFYDPAVTRDKIPLSQSVYKGWKLYHGAFLSVSPVVLAPNIQLGNQMVGADKLEHMFGMGFKYFNSHYLKGKSLEKPLKYGILLEKVMLGGNMFATGVFAYGDLAANFNGMRFWNHMLQKRDDVLGKDYNIGPYVSCQDGKWVAVKEIDFRSYVDASMDESINCSKFANRGGFESFNRSMKSFDASFTCPLDPEKLKAMVKKYDVVIPTDPAKRTISHWIINEDHGGPVHYIKEFRRSGKRN